MRVTMAVTWALSARPLPVTAALTSVGVCMASGRPSRAAAQHRDGGGLRGAHDPLDVGLGEDPLDRDRVGRGAGPATASISACRANSRSSGASVCGVRTTPTATIRSGWPSPPSTMPRPHRVSPGSTPSTRTGATSFVVAPAVGPNRCSAPTLHSGRPDRPAGHAARRRAGAVAADPSRGPRRRSQASPQSSSSSSSASTSSLTSPLAQTFCTSSLSSRASMTRNILRAPSASSSTCRVGTNEASAES